MASQETAERRFIPLAQLALTHADWEARDRALKGLLEQREVSNHLTHRLINTLGPKTVADRWQFAGVAGFNAEDNWIGRVDWQGDAASVTNRVKHYCLSSGYPLTVLLIRLACLSVPEEDRNPLDQQLLGAIRPYVPEMQDQ